MADLVKVMKSLVGIIRARLISDGITNVLVGSEWPTAEQRKQAANGGPQIVALIHKTTAYKSDIMPFEHWVEDFPLTIEGAISDPSMAPGRSTTLTVEYADGASSVNPGDIISCSFSNIEMIYAATYTAVQNDTLASVAAGLAAAIHAALPDMTASASGAVITITNSGIRGFSVSTKSGSPQTSAIAVDEAIRSMQVNAWCGGLASKYQCQKSIESTFSFLTKETGFELDTTEWIEFKKGSATPLDSETDKNLFVDAYLCTLTHYCDVIEKKYPIVAVIPLS